MIAVGRTHRFGNFAGLQTIHHRFEFRHCIARAHPADVAAASGGVVNGIQTSECGKVCFTRGDAVANVVQAREHLVFRREVGDEHQDVAHVGLLDGRAGELGLDAVATVFEENDVNGTRRAHRRDEVALRAVVFNGLPENGRQTRGIAPSQITARQSVFGLGVGCSQRTEVLSVADAFNQSFCFTFNIARFRVGSARRDRQQNVTHVVFLRVIGCKARLFGKERIDFTFRNRDLAVDFSFAQTLRRDFVAHLRAERAEAHIVGAKTLAQFVDGHLVVARDLFDRGAHHLLIDANAQFLGSLLGGLFGDHALKHLTAQFLHRGQIDVLLTQVDGGLTHTVLQFVFRDDVVIDDGGDAVGELGRTGLLFGQSLAFGSGNRLRLFGRRFANLTALLSKSGQRGQNEDGCRQSDSFIGSSHRYRWRWARGCRFDSPGCCVAVRRADLTRLRPDRSILTARRSSFHHSCLHRECNVVQQRAASSNPRDIRRRQDFQ